MEFASLAFAVLLLAVAAFLAGKDFAECAEAARREEEGQRFREIVRNGYEGQHEVKTVPARRICPNGPEHCLCNVCAPTEHQQAKQQRP